MSERTRADTDLIKDCSNSLFRIHREFKENSNPADDCEKSLGSDELRNIFDDFSETWKKTRKKLMEDIHHLAKFTQTAAEAYDKVDHELAQALRDTRKSRRKK
ncbi:hypothetical protein ACFYYR_10020 [Streptomyces sp. NPDC001922]|uniref:hypothetical protein n=1 Tax=Streptomyces sp. NPDC001922 TaxID=3364624 RepID=UPI00367D54EE